MQRENRAQSRKFGNFHRFHHIFSDFTDRSEFVAVLKNLWWLFEWLFSWCLSDVGPVVVKSKQFFWRIVDDCLIDCSIDLCFPDDRTEESGVPGASPVYALKENNQIYSNQIKDIWNARLFFVPTVVSQCRVPMTYK